MDAASYARVLALAGIEVRATTAEAGGGGGSGKKTAHEPAGSPKGGQFTSRPGGGGSKAKHARPAKRTPAPAQSVPQASATPRLVKEGDSGEDVRYAQYAMSLLGFKVAQDGRFGPETAAAVKQMQQRLGMKHPNGHITPALLHKMQDAVRLSPCVGGQRDLSFEAQWEQRDDGLEDGDLAFDETAEAVLDALDEFERAAGGDWAERAHDVSGELRIPHGKGGGRWTKSPITSAIAKALEEWTKGNGPDDDPFVFDGKPIDREPLRKAAVARGITLRRGATRDEIVKALKADVGVKVREAKAAKPEVGKPVRFTLSGGSGRSEEPALRGAAVYGALPIRDTDSLDKATDGDFKVRDAVGDYSDQGYQYVNYALRTTGGDPSKFPEAVPAVKGLIPSHYSRRRALDQVEGIDKVMGSSRTTAPVVLQRAMVDLPPGWPKRNPAGFEWTDHAFVSTSADGRGIAKFGHVRMEIHVPAGTGAIGVDNSQPGLRGEREVLLQRGLRFRVTGSRNEGGRTVHEVEVVPKSDSKLRNLDVGVFTEGGKVSLWEVSDSGERRRRVALVGDLAGLESWATEHGESELAGWARKERGGAEAPKASPTKRAPAEGAAALAAAPASLVTGRGLTTAQKSALRYYQDQGAHDRINNALRQGADVSKMARVGQIDAAMAVSPLAHAVVVDRGAHGEHLFGDPKNWPADLTGREWTEAGYLSTSAQPSRARGFGGEHSVVLHLNVPAGTPAIAMSRYERPNGMPDEAELLLGRGLHLRVTGDRMVRNEGSAHPDYQHIRVLDVDVVPSGKATKATKKAIPPADFDKRLSSAATGNDALAAAPTLVHYDEAADKWTVTGVPNADKVGKAVHDYWDYGQDVNKYLRDGPDAFGRKGVKLTAPQVEATIAGVDSLFDSSRLDKPVVTWRGFGGRSVFGGDPDGWPDNLAGHEWTDKAYVSTAVDRAEAANFVTGGSAGAADTRGVMARILLPEGGPVLSMGEFEAGEMLLSRGWKFRVVADHGWHDEKRGSTVRHQRLLDVEAIPPNAPETPVAPAKATKAAKKAAPTAQPAGLDHLRTLDTEARRDALDLRKVEGPDGLKALLKSQGLPVSGKKRDLVDRLVASLGGGGTASAQRPPNPRATELGRRIDALAEEAAPLRDFFARYLQTDFHSAEDHRAYEANRKRLQELVQEGRTSATELLAELIADDGEPWGGDPATDADRWSGDLHLDDRGNLSADEARRIRDKYVVDDRNTLAQNASLRSAEPTSAAQAWGSRMSKWIKSSELGRDTTLHRGAALRPELIAELRPGAILHDRGIVSADQDPSNADFYAGERLDKTPGTIKTLFEIRVPQGTPAVEAGYGEIVLDRGNRFRIISSRPDENGVIHVVMELIQ